MSYLRHLSYMTVAKSLVLSSFVTLCDCQERIHLNSYSNRHQRRTERGLDSHYTHVILGFGTAGSSAVRELLKHGSHGDTVLIVDPVANVKKIGFPHQEDKRLVFEENQATNIDHVHKIVELADGSRIKYQNCLISVGSSAAPFNPQYVDAACDLQHTVVNLNHPNAPHDLYQELMSDSGTGELAKKGKNVALVGANSWESVELAGRLAMAAEQKHHEQVQQAVKRQKQQAQQRLKTLQSQLSTGGNNNTKNGNGAPTNKSSVGALTLTPPLSMPTKDIVSLIYPAYGPMSHSLPRYLSLALAKRLHGLGVHLVPYSYVRYLGAGTPANTTSAKTTSIAAHTGTTTTSTTSPQAVLFLAKTYDSLNTHSIIADKVTFAPSSLPTVQDRELFKSHHTDPQTELNPTDKPSMNEFHPHGFLLRSGLELDRITGGVVANSSLQVCEGIYAAGDIASVYVGSGTGVDLRDSAELVGGGTSSSEQKVHPIQQRGVVRGYHNALYSGTVAGRNMAYSVSTTNDSTSACAHLLYNHIPISEVHSSDIGVHFTFVGTCSSALETHGYWWKLAEKAKTATPVTTSATASASSTKGAGSTSSEASESMRPPLGLGVVFYIDNNVIAGVLVSGLPVAPLYTSTNDDRSAATGNGATSGASGSATYTDHVHALCKSLIGKSVKSLDTYSSTSNGSKRIDISHAYEVPVDEVVSDDEAAVYKSNAISTPDTTGISTSSSTSIEGEGTKNIASAIIAATTTTADTNTTSSAVAEVYTSQALSWEARKLISPVLSAPLYKQLATSASPTSTNTASSSLLSKQISSYPRPLYRYCGPSHTTIKDLTEPHTHAVIQPAVVREALFQPEFANTGSRADNVKTAYKRSMAKNIY